jgi:hypothetical protein
MNADVTTPRRPGEAHRLAVVAEVDAAKSYRKIK